jgi:hypothetical protein
MIRPGVLSICARQATQFLLVVLGGLELRCCNLCTNGDIGVPWWETWTGTCLDWVKSMLAVLSER